MAVVWTIGICRMVGLTKRQRKRGRGDPGFVPALTMRQYPDHSSGQDIGRSNTIARFDSSGFAKHACSS